MSTKQVYIGINYKTDEKTLSWVSSILRHDKNSLILLVDNTEGRQTDLGQKLNALNKQIVYLDTNANTGFLGGAYFGYDYLQRNNISFDWIFVSNVDLLLDSDNPGTFLEKYNDYEVVAPKIQSFATGLDHNPYRLNRLSKKQMLIKKIIHSNMFFATLYSGISKRRGEKIKQQNSVLPEGTTMYMPYGACMAFNKSFFAAGGTIKYPLFLFGEEMFVAEQCFKLGLKIVYVPSIKFIDFEHASTSALPSSFVVKNNYEAMKFILNEFY